MSGKAAPAALYAALTSGIMRAAAAQHPSPATMLKLLNDSLHERKVDSQYVTMVFAVWNDDDQTLQIANAGSVQPLVCRAGEVEPVHAEGFPLGLFRDVSYEEFTLSTRPGDAIVFYSDGIVDALNEKEEMFGEDRMIAVVRRHLDGTAEALADAIFAELADFQEGRERFDDETVVVLKVLESLSGTMSAQGTIEHRFCNSLRSPRIDWIDMTLSKTDGANRSGHERTVRPATQHSWQSPDSRR